MVSVYREAIRTFLPTPAKSHYSFSLRDITRVFQGIVMVPPKRMPDPEKLGRLWAHETYRVFYDRWESPLTCILLLNFLFFAAWWMNGIGIACLSWPWMPASPICAFPWSRRLPIALSRARN